MTQILPQDTIYYNIAKNEADKYYISEINNLIFADCNCQKYIQKCYDDSCYSQSTQRIDGCVINAVSFSDLKEITRDIFFKIWDNSPKIQIDSTRYLCPSC